MKLATRIKKYIDDAKLTNFSLLASLSITSEDSLRVTISRLVKNGEVYNPVKGVYVSKYADTFWVASHIYPGYISLSTSFYLHHITDEYPFTIFVASDISKSVVIGNSELLYFKVDNQLGVEKGDYQVASVEKGIYDSLKYRRFVSFYTLTKVLYYCEINANKFIELSKDENPAFFQRLGYLLSILPNIDKEKEKIISFCKSKVKSNIYLQGRSKGKYISKWKIVDNISEEVLLSWWLQ